MMVMILYWKYEIEILEEMELVRGKRKRINKLGLQETSDGGK